MKNKVDEIKNKEEIRASIRQNYSQIALNGAQGGCCSGGCCCGNGNDTDLAEVSARNGYSEEELNSGKESNLGLGCGNPIAIASLREGETVLDLGSGGGFDCFLARKQVGASGLVIGVDMTPDMISLARRNAEKLGYTNVEFRLGEIEHLPIADRTVDVIISNCVLNLALEKEKVIKEAYRVLKSGGRLIISDVVATAALSEEILADLNLISGCIGGAALIDELQRMFENTGFQNIRMAPKENSREIIKSWAPEKSLEDVVASYLIEARKLEGTSGKYD